MTVNELANELEKGAHTCESHFVIAARVLAAAKLLRQQEAEIDALRSQIKHLEPQVYGGTTK
jgi:hypothetical protein